MKNILILYPKLFNCYDKFYRKISKIISNTNELSIVFPHDHNGFIAKFSKDNLPSVELLNITDWNISDVTHGIIFDDDDEFSEETELLKLNNIPLRPIKILITRVINIKNDTQYKSEKSTSTYEYIGRGSCWGNPYSIYDIEDLDEGEDPRRLAINNYKYDFEHGKWFKDNKNEVYKLAGKRLGCFCKPLACHGDVLADFLNAWDDGH